MDDVGFLTDTVKKYSVFYGKDIMAVYHLIANGFSIYATRDDHPPVFGMTYRGRKACWKEFFDKMEERGAIGNLMQPACPIADCFWAYSRQRKQISKFLLHCEFTTGGMLPVPGRKNDPDDIKWAVNKIIHLWKLTFPERECPAIEIIGSVSNIPYSMKDQAEASIGETEYQKALAFLHSNDSGKKIMAVKILTVINNSESFEMLFKILYRETDAAALEAAVMASIELGLNREFCIRLHETYLGYARDTDQYDDPEERMRWRFLMEKLIENDEELHFSGFPVARDIEEIEDDFLSGHPLLVTAGFRDLVRWTADTQKRSIRCFPDVKNLLMLFGDEPEGTLIEHYIYALTELKWRPVLSADDKVRIFLQLITSCGGNSHTSFYVYMYLLKNEQMLEMMIKAVGRIKRFSNRTFEALCYFIFLFLDGKMMRDKTVRLMSEWPATSGLAKVVSHNRGLLSQHELQLFSQFRLNKIPFKN